MSNPESKIVEFRSPTGDLLRQVAECGHEKPWFIAKDVCEALGLTHVTNALRPLEPDEKGCKTITTPGGPQEMAIVSEPGLYSLIGRSRKPEAKAFKRWVNHEVLPSIRRTGSYSVHATPAQNAPDLNALVAQLIRKVDALEAKLATANTSFASVNELAGIRHGLERASRAAAFSGAYKSKSAARTGIENRVRTACEWPRATGCSLSRMPAACVPYAQRAIAEIEREYSRFENVRQLPLKGAS